MWQEQYEKGEVPVSENIQSRTEWVDKDIVLITNTLNKLLSVDENVRQQGLDDVGYLLPIFMINNLTGEELIIYLKAKLEAAKAVMKQFNKDKKVETDVEDEEDEVFVERAEKKEEAKTMELEQEMDIPEESKDKQSADNPAPAERTEGTTQVEPPPTAPTDKSTT